MLPRVTQKAVHFATKDTKNTDPPRKEFIREKEDLSNNKTEDEDPYTDFNFEPTTDDSEF